MSPSYSHVDVLLPSIRGSPDISSITKMENIRYRGCLTSLEIRDNHKRRTISRQSRAVEMSDQYERQVLDNSSLITEMEIILDEAKRLHIQDGTGQRDQEQLFLDDDNPPNARMGGSGQKRTAIVKIPKGSSNNVYNSLQKGSTMPRIEDALEQQRRMAERTQEAEYKKRSRNKREGGLKAALITLEKLRQDEGAFARFSERVETLKKGRKDRLVGARLTGDTNETIQEHNRIVAKNYSPEYQARILHERMQLHTKRMDAAAEVARVQRQKQESARLDVVERRLVGHDYMRKKRMEAQRNRWRQQCWMKFFCSLYTVKRWTAAMLDSRSAKMEQLEELRRLQEVEKESEVVMPFARHWIGPVLDRARKRRAANMIRDFLAWHKALPPLVDAVHRFLLLCHRIQRWWRHELLRIQAQHELLSRKWDDVQSKMIAASRISRTSLPTLTVVESESDADTEIHVSLFQSDVRDREDEDEWLTTIVPTYVRWKILAEDLHMRKKAFSQRMPLSTPHGKRSRPSNQEKTHKTDRPTTREAEVRAEPKPRGLERKHKLPAEIHHFSPMCSDSEMQELIVEGIGEVNVKARRHIEAAYGWSAWELSPSRADLSGVTTPDSGLGKGEVVDSIDLPLSHSVNENSNAVVGESS
jgi:hypothetical protein